MHECCFQLLGKACVFWTAGCSPRTPFLFCASLSRSDILLGHLKQVLRCVASISQMCLTYQEMRIILCRNFKAPAEMFPTTLHVLGQSLHLGRSLTCPILRVLSNFPSTQVHIIVQECPPMPYLKVTKNNLHAFTKQWQTCFSSFVRKPDRSTQDVSGAKREKKRARFRDLESAGRCWQCVPSRSSHSASCSRPGVLQALC